MKLGPLSLLVLLVTVVTMSSCKFYFSESEYLGIYPGEFKSQSSLYKSCDGTLILTDAGENRVDMELTTDSNATIYFTDVLVKRGYSLGSESLRLNDPSDNLEGEVNRNTHYLYVYYYAGTSYYTYSFRGNRE